MQDDRQQKYVPGLWASSVERRRRACTRYVSCGGVGTDDAQVLVFCDSEQEAKSYRGSYGTMACYSYTATDGELTDERWEWDYHAK